MNATIDNTMKGPMEDHLSRRQFPRDILTLEQKRKGAIILHIFELNYRTKDLVVFSSQLPLEISLSSTVTFQYDRNMHRISGRSSILTPIAPGRVLVTRSLRSWFVEGQCAEEYGWRCWGLQVLWTLTTCRVSMLYMYCTISVNLASLFYLLPTKSWPLISLPLKASIVFSTPEYTRGANVMQALVYLLIPISVKLQKTMSLTTYVRRGFF